MGWQPGEGQQRARGFGQSSRNSSRSQQTPGICTGLELPRVLHTMIPQCPFFGLHFRSTFSSSSPSKTKLGRLFPYRYTHADLDRSSGVMCAAEFAIGASSLETTGWGRSFHLEMEISIFHLIKSAVGGSGCQGLCSHQYSSKNKPLRPPGPLVSIPAVRLTPWFLPGAAAMQKMKISCE